MITGLGKSPGGGHGNPLQYSGLENSMGCLVYEASENRTWLSELPSLTLTAARSQAFFFWASSGLNSLHLEAPNCWAITSIFADMAGNTPFHTHIYVHMYIYIYIYIYMYVCTHTYMCDKLLNHVQFFATLWSPPGSLSMGILQARILKWVGILSLQKIFWTQGLN